ncbi:MAG: M23 family metallopeptidase [Dehalococcoidia bacterium]
MIRTLLAAFTLVLVIGACGGDDDAPTTSRSATATDVRSPGAPTATLTIAPTPTERAPHPEPAGFPIDPETTLGVVASVGGTRTLVFGGGGPNADDYALYDQPSMDGDIANRSGWNCRTHVEYEGSAAVDFYIPTGTPILATMDGAVTLYAISVVNDFDRYSVDREPYIGNPDRSRAPISPFPGPSGGLGVYAQVEGESFVTEYGHLDLALTDEVVPEDAFVSGYSAESDWATLFAEVPQPRFATRIAEWQVRAGDVIGMSGDSGYSEGPHVHYAIARYSGPLLCPTNEEGFDDGGWLFR